MFLSWLRKLLGLKSRGPQKARRLTDQPRRQRVKLSFEALEQRLTPATYNWDGVATLSVSLATNESLSIVNTGATNPAVTFTLSGGADTWTATGTTADGGAAGAVLSFNTNADLATSITINNAGAGAGTNNVTFTSGTISSGAISVDTTAGTGTGSIAVNAPVSTTGGGAVNLTASGAVSETGGSLSTSGTLTTSSSTGTTLGGANAVGTFTASNSTSGAISLSNTIGTLTVAGIAQSGTAAGSDVSVTNGGNLTTSTAAITTTAAANGNISLMTMASSGTLTVGLGAAVTAGGSGMVTLDTAFVHNDGPININAPVSSTSGEIFAHAFGALLSENANITTGGTVYLDIGGGVSQISGAISASALLLGGGNAAFTLSDSNAVSTLASSNTGALTFNDGSKPLAVGTVLGHNGIATDDNDATLCSGTLSVNTGIIVGGLNTVRLQSSGAVSEGVAGGITAANLGVNAAGTVMLTSSLNDVSSVFAATAPAAISFTDSVGFSTGQVTSSTCFSSTVNGVSTTANNGNINLIATSGNLTVGTPNGNVSANGSGSVTLQANNSASSDIDINGTASSTTGAISATAGLSIAFGTSGAVTTSTSASGANVTLTGSSTGTITEAGSNTAVTGNGLSLTAGGGIGTSTNPITMNGTTLTANSSASNGNQFLADTATVTIAGTGLNAGTGTIDLTGGTFDLSGNNQVNANSTLQLDAGTFAMITFNDLVAQLIVNGGTASGSTGTLTSTGLIDARSGSVSAMLTGSNGLTKSTSGTLTLSSSPLVTITGNLTLSAGTLNAPATTLKVSGNFANGGTFTADGGTVVLNGTGQSISGSTTFYNLTKTISTADTLTFAAGSTQTISGTLTLQGVTGNLLSLRSSNSPTQWNITPSGTRNVSFVDVQDSVNTTATVINPASSHDSGNNVRWFSTSDQLNFFVQPTSAFAGQTIAPSIQVEALSGNTRDMSFTGPITLTFGTNSGSPIPGVFGGLTTMNAVLGVATFTVSISSPGLAYTLAASSTSPGVTSATSNPFNIIVGAAVFGINTANNQVYEQKFDWNGNAIGAPFQPSQLAGTTVTAVAAGQDGSGRIELFAVKSLDGQVYRVNFNQAGNPTTGFGATAVLSGGAKVLHLAATNLPGNNAPEVFVTRSDNLALNAMIFNSTGTTTSGYFVPPNLAPTTSGDQLYGQNTALAAGKDGAGNPEVFILGTDTRPYILNFSADGTTITSTSTNPLPPAGYTKGYISYAQLGLPSNGHGTAITAGSTSAGNPEMFVLGTDEQVYAITMNSAGNLATSSYFVPTGGSGQALAEAAAKDLSTSAPQVWVIGTDNHIYTEKLNPAGTTSGGFVATAPAMQFKAIAVANDPPVGWTPEQTAPPSPKVPPVNTTTVAVRLTDTANIVPVAVVGPPAGPALAALPANTGTGKAVVFTFGADLLAVLQPVPLVPETGTNSAGVNRPQTFGVGLDSGNQGNGRGLSFSIAPARFSAGENQEAGTVLDLVSCFGGPTNGAVLDRLGLADLDSVFAGDVASPDGESS